MKRILTLFCAALLTVSGAELCELPDTAFAEELTSGFIGSKVSWKLEDETLTISGKDALPNGRLNILSLIGTVRTLVVEDGITGIGSNCFMHMPELETVILPDSINHIGTQAFLDCPNLKAFQCPESGVSFGAEVFSYDEKLFDENETFCIIGDALVGYQAEDAAEIVIPENVRRIAKEVFAKHMELTSVKLPDGLETIGDGAFANCKHLSEIRIPDSVKTIGSSAFESCCSLKTVHIPAGVTEISAYAFAGCSSLKTVTGCETLETIRSNAFFWCEKLEHISLSGTVRSIEPKAFEYCNALREANTVDDLYMIGGVLMRKSKSAAIYTLPDQVTVIAPNALSNVRAVEINCPEALRHILENAFEGNPVLMCLNINDGCETIGENAFSKCSSLTALTIPASVTEIGAQADCSITDIYGTPGTAAERFAAENNILFHDVAEPVLSGIDRTPDPAADFWSFANTSSVFGKEYYTNAKDWNTLMANHISTKTIEKAWTGSCVGLSVAAILVQSGFIQPEQLQEGAKTLSEVQPTKTAQSFINYYQCIYAQNEGSDKFETDAQLMYRIVRTAGNIPNGASPFLLTFTTRNASHGVVGYGLEAGEWEFDGKTYDGRVLIWDSNAPQGLRETSCVYYDSETLDYCIPQYGVHVAEGASDNTSGIIAVVDDLRVLNAYPHPLSRTVQGDISGDGIVSVSDAVLLIRICSEDPAVSRYTPQDLDGDGYLTVSDVTALLKMLAKMS